MSAIDLARYCNGTGRPEIAEPFSRGQFSYGTNGHILIRVPLRDDVRERDNAPKPEGLFPATKPQLKAARFSNLPPLPEREPAKTILVECMDCDGRGKEHFCPDCECVCENCAGEGRVKKTTGPTEEIVFVKLRGSFFDLKYVHAIAGLGGLMLPKRAPTSKAMFFEFAGGDGLLMPLRYTRETFIEAEGA